MVVLLLFRLWNRRGAPRFWLSLPAPRPFASAHRPFCRRQHRRLHQPRELALLQALCR